MTRKEIAEALLNLEDLKDVEVKLRPNLWIKQNKIDLYCSYELNNKIINGMAQKSHKKIGHDPVEVLIERIEAIRWCQGCCSRDMAETAVNDYRTIQVAGG